MCLKAKVLFIDSDSNMRQVYQDILAEEDLKLITAASFSEAVELMAKYEFQIIYLELQLPTAESLLLLREIRQKTPACCIAVLSSWESASIASEILQYGASDYLVKPFTSEMLKLSIHRCLKHHCLLLKEKKLEQNVAQLIEYLSDVIRNLQNFKGSWNNC
jgi:DNA-binding NtrC family response regulator